MNREETSPNLKSGQTVRIYYRIHEGSKTRIQPYEGMIIAIRGEGIGKTVTVRKEGADHIGVERIFPLRSPNMEKIEVVSQAKVRRSKLYFMRGLSSKSVRKMEKA